MPIEDRRLVQTAVTGHAESAEPAYMPLDPDEAEEFRDQARARDESHWCGVLLGGCGGQLSLKIIHERQTVPHFAHRAGSNLCARMAKGAEATLGGQSADHLYAHRHLRSWLDGHKRAVDTPPTYKGLGRGRACTELIIPTSHKPLRLVFTHDLDHDLVALAKSRRAHDYVWLVRANEAVTRALVANHVPYRLFRLAAGADHTRTVQVGIRDSAGEVSWTPLAACVLQGDTLVKARTEAAPAPARPRPEPRETAAAADPLEQALGGLRHALGQQDVANVRAMAQQVQMRLRQTRTRGLAPHLSEEARTLLEQASAALPVRQTHTAPRRTPVVSARVREDRRRTAFAHDHIRQAVDKHIGKLLWAQERRLSRAYNDNRAALVRLLNRPDAPKDVVDRIKHQLRVSPKGQFDPPSNAPPAQKPRPAPAASEGRGRTRDAAQRKERRIHAKTDELLDTLRWAHEGKMPQTYDDTRTRLLGVLGGTGTPATVKDTIRQQLSFYPEGLLTPQVPAPAPPPKQPQGAKRQRRGGKPRSRSRRSPAPADGADTGLLANARIDERSRHLLEQLRAAPRPSTPEGG